MAGRKAKAPKSDVPAIAAPPKPKAADFLPAIIEQMVEGKSLREICAQDGYPSMYAFLRLVAADPEVETVYRAAAELRADGLFEKMMAVASTPMQGEKTKTTESDDGVKTETTTGDMVEHRKLQVDTLKWALARMNPKKYGDKVDMTHGGKVKVISLTADDEAI